MPFLCHPTLFAVSFHPLASFLANFPSFTLWQLLIHHKTPHLTSQLSSRHVLFPPCFPPIVLWFLLWRSCVTSPHTLGARPHLASWIQSNWWEWILEDTYFTKRCVEISIVCCVSGDNIHNSHYNLLSVMWKHLLFFIHWNVFTITHSLWLTYTDCPLLNNFL